MIHFTVLGVPKGKGRPRFFRKGDFVGTFTPDKTRAAESSVLAQALGSKPAKPLQGPVYIRMVFFMPIPKSKPKAWQEKREKETTPHKNKPDVDNLVKGILDPLNEVFWEDDRQIFYLSAVKLYGKVPRTEVWIKEEEE